MLELGGFSRPDNKKLGDVVAQFTAHLEPVKPLEPRELEALNWLRERAFQAPAKPAKIG
jgi:hypothetical protein